jgi:hypothetical protein
MKIGILFAPIRSPRKASVDQPGRFNSVVSRKDFPKNFTNNALQNRSFKLIFSLALFPRERGLQNLIAFVFMGKNGTVGHNDRWHVNLGAFPSGTTIRYAVEVTSPSRWDNNSGQDHHANPITCPEGGCFKTGVKWPYVWTRDSAYSVALALA